MRPRRHFVIGRIADQTAAPGKQARSATLMHFCRSAGIENGTPNER
jgi:hypothetical protein